MTFKHIGWLTVLLPLAGCFYSEATCRCKDEIGFVATQEQATCGDCDELKATCIDWCLSQDMQLDKLENCSVKGVLICNDRIAGKAGGVLQPIPDATVPRR
jgi:hypothetical protein